jgi:hypothetical protein
MLKLNKIRKTTIALSTLLLMGTAMSTAQARYTDGISEKTKARAAAAYSAEQNQWWDEYTASGKKAAEYIESVAESNPKAAMWFLLTGGKYGFANRKATDDEARMMLSAMGKIATHYGKNENKDAGLEAWKQAELTRDGQVHLAMLYDKLNEFEARIDTLTGEKALLQTELNGVNRRVGVLETQVTGLTSEVQSLRDQLTRAHDAQSALQTLVEAKNQQLVGEIKAHADIMQQKEEQLRTERIQSEEKLRADMMRLLEAVTSRQDQTVEQQRRNIDQQGQTIQQVLLMVQELSTRIDQNRAEAKASEDRFRAEAKAEQARLYAVIEANSRIITLMTSPAITANGPKKNKINKKISD